MIAKRKRLFCLFAWLNRMLGEAMCRGRSPGEPREAWRGAAPAPWGFLFRPLWGPGAAPSRQVPRFWLLVTWPQASLSCVAGGGAAAKRWGNPAGVPFTRCVDFFAVIGLSTARTGFKVLNKFQCFRAGNCKKTHLNQWLTNMPGV